jgi:protocatechuate 3,4-dioxygenase beta subunit
MTEQAPAGDGGLPTRLRPQDPPYDWPGYRSSVLRAPKRPLVLVPASLLAPFDPLLGARAVAAGDADLTRQHAGEPLGERIIVFGTVTGGGGRPLAGQLVEVWQANAAGRYAHERDRHAAPLDPNFSGAGRCVTDAEGRYRFVTVRPGAYPWRNHENAWRPAHVHFSLFGRAFTSRLVTQMYFPGDPLLEHDPIFQSVPASARHLLVAELDLATTEPEWALAYRFDISLDGACAEAT